MVIIPLQPLLSHGSLKKRAHNLIFSRRKKYKEEMDKRIG